MSKYAKYTDNSKIQLSRGERAKLRNMNRGAAYSDEDDNKDNDDNDENEDNEEDVEDNE